MTHARRQARPPDWTAEQHADIAGEMTAWEAWRALNARPPIWLAAAYRLRDLLTRPFGVAPIAGHGGGAPDALPPRPGDTVQFFTVDAIGPDLVTLSVEDGHLDVLTHIRVLPAGPASAKSGRMRVEVGSQVWTWNRVGRVYMMPTGIGHRLLVAGMLKRLARDMPPPCGAASARPRDA